MYFSQNGLIKGNCMNIILHTSFISTNLFLNGDYFCDCFVLVYSTKNYTKLSKLN